MSRDQLEKELEKIVSSVEVSSEETEKEVEVAKRAILW